jgi:hypothetical protein
MARAAITQRCGRKTRIDAREASVRAKGKRRMAETRSRTCHRTEIHQPAMKYHRPMFSERRNQIATTRYPTAGMGRNGNPLIRAQTSKPPISNPPQSKMIACVRGTMLGIGSGGRQLRSSYSVSPCMLRGGYLGRTSKRWQCPKERSSPTINHRTNSPAWLPTHAPHQHQQRNETGGHDNL